MADWTYTPTYTYSIRQDPPTTLITTYEDGYESRREKFSFTGSEKLRTFVEQHVVTGNDMSGMITFWESKYNYTSFTKVTYDPDEAGGAEATVRFVGPLGWTQVGPDRFETEITFREVRN